MREGHGKYVEWTRKETGTLKNVVEPVRDAATGKIKVPDAECIGKIVCRSCHKVKTLVRG